MDKLGQVFSDPTEPTNGRMINGRRWHESSGTKYILQEYNYKRHLEEIKQSLESGAGRYLISILDETNKDSASRSAVFGLVRMIMPSIEAIARAQGIGPGTLLGLLKVPGPNLVWNLYRDVLTHNEEWVKAKIGQKTIRPSIWISMSGSDGITNMHVVNPHTGTHTLNVGILYYDLIEHLDQEIKKAPKDKMIKIIIGIEYVESTQNREVQLIIGEARKTEEDAQSTEDWFIRHYEMKSRRMGKP
jgi:hypothetical protein